jgi:PDZ domain-containing secreted protein
MTVLSDSVGTGVPIAMPADPALRRRTAGGRPLLWRLCLAAAVLLAAFVKARFAWIPTWYLALAVTAPSIGWWAVTRWRPTPTLRWLTVAVATVTTAAICPVPWLVAAGNPPGNAWRLDGRISIDGHSVDPAGEWYWLTVGRPLTVAELAWSRFRSEPESAAKSMRSGPLRQRARWSEPAAASVGLARGGWPIGTRVEAHVGDALLDGLPPSAVIVAVNGQQLGAARDWTAALAHLSPDRNSFTTADGSNVEFRGAELPYRDVEIVVVPTESVEVVVGGWLATTPVGRWYRNLASGSSHGLMVALVAYTYASGDEIGQGLSIAGTGTMRADGSVGRVKGLIAKATAARRAGADVLLFPRDQESELEGFERGTMDLVPVASIDEAVEALASRSDR